MTTSFHAADQVQVAAASAVAMGVGPVLDALFGVPVSVYAACFGGLMLSVVRLEPGDRFAKWPSILAHYAGALYATQLVIAWVPIAAQAPGGVGAVVGWGLMRVLPGLGALAEKLPAELVERFIPKRDKGGTDGK